MNNYRHGLSIGMERHEDNFFLSLKASGKLTHADYEIIIPLIDAALYEVRKPEINAIIDATELEGWELRAAWDDFKLGLKHGNKFSRIAIYGKREWQERLSKLANWFVSGEIRFFDDAESALEWLHQAS